MQRHTTSAGVRFVALATAACLALAPTTAHAQRGPAREALVSFGREYDTGDGFVNARITVRYQFADCAGDVAVLYAMDRESIWTASTYYYRGKSYEVPATLRSPRLDIVDFGGPVMNRAGQIEGSFSDPYTQGGAGAGCLGQSKVVFSRKSKLGERSTAEQYQDFIDGLSIHVATRPRLRSGEVESWIGQQLAKSRDDSLARVAERDKRDRDARARQDSVDRAQRADADRREREADSTRNANRQRDEQSRAGEDASERQREREQEEKDREHARQQQQNVDDQTARLKTIWEGEKYQWERAEQAYARGDFATARPLYEELAGSLVYGGQAKARLDELNSKQVAEGIVATLSLMNQLRHAIGEALHGTNLAVGGAYAQNGFPGAKGDAGMTFGYVARPMQRWVPYFDFTFGLGNDESKAQRYYPNKSFGGIVAGTTLPGLKLALGSKASLSPHFGYRWMVTDLRDVHVGQTGLTLIVPGLMLRGDAVIINGKPQLGGAISRIF